MLNVRSWLEAKENVAIISFANLPIPIPQMWIKFQPAGSFPLSISLFCPDTKPCSLMGKRDLGVH